MLRSLLIVFVLLPVLAGHCSEPTVVEPQQIQHWIRQLDADSFSVREEATRRLIDAGPQVVDAIKAAVTGDTLETSVRGMKVLHELALQNDVAAIRAEQAIRAFAESGATAVSQRAQSALASLDGIRTERGIKLLKQLGASIESFPGTYDNTVVAQRFITFGKKWRGTIDDLAYLSWITDFDRIHLTLRGEYVTNEWIARLAKLDHIVGLQINRTRVTDAGLAPLPKMTQLESLSLRYNLMSDDSLPHLRATATETSLSNLSVYGTQISQGAVKTLQANHESLRTSYRRGGFLGVIGNTDARAIGCQIRAVQPNHAAARAGVLPRDIITKYGEHTVSQFSRAFEAVPDGDPQVPTLSELIGADPPGTHVQIVILRGGQQLTKEVVLGEWP